MSAVRTDPQPDAPPPGAPPLLFRVLSSMTRRLPNLPHASGLSNRLVKPLWCRMHPGAYQITVWDGVEMIVDPAEALGGNLAFIPHLYDAWERQAIRDLLPEGGTFVDVGANIGAYTLWAARVVGPSGLVLSYEAEPTNFASLLQNVALNRFDQVKAYRVGVSDKSETLQLQLSPGDNSGGHSFARDCRPAGCVTEIAVACDRLAVLLEQAGAARVDFMKLDIERFEQRVLARFFQDVGSDSALRPRRLLVELYASDANGPGTLWDTIVAAGYRLERRGKTNALFVR